MAHGALRRGGWSHAPCAMALQGARLMVRMHSNVKISYRVDSYITLVQSAIPNCLIYTQ
ncbi:hypothetical protein YC2023_090352 [Brassica napus]